MANQFIITNAALYSVISEWKGDASAEYGMTPQYHNSPVSAFLRTELQRMDVYENGADYTLYDVLSYFQPAISENNGWKQIALWPSLAARNTGPVKRLSCKPGRAFRRMLPPETPDTVIERLVDAYRKAFDDSGYTLKTGEDSDAFHTMYSGAQSPMQNPLTTNWRKSLANSCMRYDFAGLPAHPCEAYASGDFRAVWVVDSDELIAARCVVRIDCETPRNGPIYGTSESAMDRVQTYLNSINAEPANYGDWSGARLVRKMDGGGYVAPYLDIAPQCLSDEGDWLVIEAGGEIDASEYSGILSGGIACDDCGDRYSEDEIRTDDDGTPYCDCCYSERYTVCERCHDETPVDDIETVVTTGWRHSEIEENWCSHCARLNAAEPEDDARLFDTDLLVCLHDGEYMTQDGEYTVCELTGDCYRLDETSPLVSGAWASTDELESHPDYWLNENGEWTDEPRPDEDDDSEDENGDSLVPVNVAIGYSRECHDAPRLSGPVECHNAASSADFIGQCGRGIFGPFEPGDTRAPFPVNIMARDETGAAILPAVVDAAHTSEWLNSHSYFAAMAAQYWAYTR